MSDSADLIIESAVRTVTAAGTREKLQTGTPEAMRVRSVTIRALRTNGGNIHVGDVNVANTPAFSYVLAPGENVSYHVTWEGWQRGEAINLSKIYIDADVNGEGVCYTVVR